MILKLKFVDTSVDKNPLSDVSVLLYKDDAFVVSGVSGNDGYAIFDIAAGFYKAIVSCPTLSGYGVKNPYGITLSQDNTTYEIPIELFENPVATRNGYCRCSGFFESIYGRALKSAAILFKFVKSWNLRYGIGLLAEDFVVSIDDYGYADVELPRGAEFSVSIPGFYPFSWFIRVPDREWANLPDVLFPFVKRVEFEPAGLNISAGETKAVSVKMIYRSGLEIYGSEYEDDWPVSFKSSDETVAIAMRREDGSLSVSGLKQGTASISVVPNTSGDTIESFPPWTEVQGELSVVVS